MRIVEKKKNVAMLTNGKCTNKNLFVKLARRKKYYFVDRSVTADLTV